MKYVFHLHISTHKHNKQGCVLHGCKFVIILYPPPILQSLIPILNIIVYILVL